MLPNEDETNLFTAELMDLSEALVRQALRITATPAVAEDVVFSIFAAVLERYMAGRGRPDALENYLRRAVRNSSIKALKQRKAVGLTFQSMDTALSRTACGPMPVEDLIEVRNALEELILAEYEVVYIVRIAGLTQGECGEILGWSQPKVSRTLARAEARLRELLRDGDDLDYGSL